VTGVQTCALPILFEVRPHPDQGSGQQRLAVEPNNDGSWYRHHMGDQFDLTSWSQLRNEQRNDLGYPNGLADDGHNVHDLGQRNT